MVTVISGANEATADLAGQSIDQVRAAFSGALNIPAGARATVDGVARDGSYTLQDGDELSFVKDTAEKG